MGLQLHHFYMLTAPGAAVADGLRDLGLVEGSRNTHPGQGTANRRFFFDDAYLEFIFFVDEEEARGGPGCVFRSLDRYEAADGSPFGIVLKADGAGDLAGFPGFPYQPTYFDPGVYFTVGDNADALDEPNCFVLPLMPPAPSAEPRSPPPYERVTRIRISVPGPALSAPLARVASVDRVDIVTGRPHALEVVFGDSGHACDLRPQVPLTLRW